MEKKTIVITGSSRGIGYGIADEFLRQGHQVVVNGRNETTLKDALEKLKHRGSQVAAHVGDIQEEKTFTELIELAVSSFGKIDIWVNNAGIPQAQMYFHELPREEIEELISVNITSLMLGSRSALRFFMDQGFGKVFNMEGFGSDGRMMDKLTLYGTSKRAVHYFSKSLSREVKDENIQVGILSPGMVRTDFLNHASDAVNEAERERNRKVFDILAEEVDVVAPFLVSRMLASKKKYDRIEYLTFPRLLPKLIRLMFLKSQNADK
jgi:short-subunit dehydrogenase